VDVLDELPDIDILAYAIVLNKILYALPVYFGYLTEGHKDVEVST